MFKIFVQKSLNILRWSEKFFKSDMVYIVKNSFWLSLLQLVSYFSAFILSISFANFLPKETFGIYKYILSIVGILAITNLPGLNTAIVQATALGQEGSFKLGVRYKMLFGLLGTLLSIGLAVYYQLKNAPSFAVCFLLAAIFLPFMDSFGLYEAFLNGKKDFRKSALYFSQNQIIMLLATLAVLFIKPSVFNLILTYFLGWSLLRLFNLSRVLNHYKLNNSANPTTIKYGINLTMIQVITVIANYLDRLLVFHYLGAAELAIYTIAVAPVEQIKAIFKNLPLLALPKFSVRSIQEIKKTLNHKILIIILVSLMLTAFYVLSAPFIYKIIFSKYLDSVIYTQILSLSIVFTVLTYLFTTILQAKNKTRDIFNYNLLYSICLILLLFFLTSRYGIMGAILARVITRFLSTSFLFFIKLKD